MSQSEQNPYSKPNITFRMYALQVDLVHRAAARAGKNLSDYIRDIIVPIAARELGEEPPDLLPIKRGRHSSPIAQAAKAMGMSREDYEAMILNREATKLLAGQGEGSGERPAQRRGLGTYSGTPGESTQVRPGVRRRSGGG